MLFHNKDYIQFVTEFPCFLGHPVQSCELSTPLPMGAISWAIKIYQKLAIIKAKSKGKILHLFTKTWSNYSLSKQYGVTISTGIFLQVRYELGL